jgi:hypothetical protein
MDGAKDWKWNLCALSLFIDLKKTFHREHQGIHIQNILLVNGIPQLQPMRLSS